MLRPAVTASLDQACARAGTAAEPGLPTDRALADVTRPGLDFDTLDHLALARHPAVRAAAASQPDESAAAALTAMLEARLAGFVQLSAARVFATGRDAILQGLAHMFRPGDEVIVDAGAHPAMFDAVLASGARLNRCPAASTGGMERRLLRLGRQGCRGRMFLAVPAISGQASRMADLAELMALARTHGARVIADLSHDLGAVAPTGRGVMELQGCLGRIDVVVGNLAGAFGTRGGFAAFRDPDEAGVAATGAAALPAGRAAAALAALDLIDSPEGQRRRRRLHSCVLRLRNQLMADGQRVIGQPSPLVPVRLPMLTAQARTALLESAGLRVTLLQAPRVATHAPRWRLSLSSAQSPADIDDLVDLIRDVSRAFALNERRQAGAFTDAVT